MNNTDDFNYSPTSIKFMPVYEEEAGLFTRHNAHKNQFYDEIPIIIKVSVDNPIIINNVYRLKATPSNILVREL